MQQFSIQWLITLFLTEFGQVQISFGICSFDRVEKSRIVSCNGWEACFMSLESFLRILLYLISQKIVLSRSITLIFYSVSIIDAIPVQLQPIFTNMVPYRSMPTVQIVSSELSVVILQILLYTFQQVLIYSLMFLQFYSLIFTISTTLLGMLMEDIFDNLIFTICHIF